MENMMKLAPRRCQRIVYWYRVISECKIACMACSRT